MRGLFLLLTTMVCALATAGSQPAPRDSARQLAAGHVKEGGIRLDGKLDEPEWQSMRAGSDFTQREPSDGSPASEHTEVRVLYSSDAVYVGVLAFDSKPSGIVSELSRRDRPVQADEVSVFLDSYFDRRTAFEFAVNPSGSIRDVYYQDEYSNDPSWDPVWQVSTSKDKNGWAAEFRIPLSQLRYDAKGTRWGLQVMRRIQRKAERSYWSPYSKKSSGLASRFGTLVGLNGLKQSLRMEMRPYTVTSFRTRPEQNVGILARPRQASINVGGDVKVGVTSGLTLDATVSPDFGQVEADPAIVNLSAFESFLPEKRPFFVEGSGLFGVYLSPGQVFYSRRIGRRPQGFASPPAGGNVELPEQTRIIGAAKLTGRKIHGAGIGLMNVVTAQENATLRDSTGRVIRSSPVEPLTNYLVGRVERDFRQGSNTVGAMFTAVNRKLPAELKVLRSGSYVGVADGVHRWNNATYAFRWNVSASDVRGSRAAITALQRSPFRYYQRPDAPHVHLDTTRTKLDGSTFQLDLGKEGGAWRYGVGTSRTSSGYDVNDLGFQFSGDKRDIRMYGGYVHARPAGIFKDYQVNMTGWRTWSTGGELTETFFPFIYVGGTFRNNWTFAANPMNVNFVRRCFTCLRGGPSLRGDPFRVHYLRVTTDRRNRLALSLETYGTAALHTPSRSLSAAPTLFWKASETLNGSVAGRYAKSIERTQFVASRQALGSTHYVVAELEQNTASMTTRLNWTATPRLSLEVYAQPFVSTASYQRYSEVVRPAAEDIRDRLALLPRFSCTSAGSCSSDLNGDGTPDFSFGRPDFQFRQLRSTSVVRWEYRPGSVLFIAWQHGRSATASDPTFGGLRSFTGLLKLPSDNTLLLKANYWLSF